MECSEDGCLQCLLEERRVCPRMVRSQYTVSSAMKTAARLKCLVSRSWQRPFNTLYVPRPDLEMVGLLRNIVLNTNQSICQVTTTAAERSGQLKRMELRARQRSNYEHLLASVSAYHCAIVTVVKLVCESARLLSLDSGTSLKHTKFLKKLLRFSENFCSQTSPAKNRWLEAAALCHTLWDLAEDMLHTTMYLSKPDCHVFR